ncbi:hypothetical protein FRC00_005461 [Tulasnella sp. 408]|nr:hypothetical protein FRC00_005461 [Tulasnella sp. 408]
MASPLLAPRSSIDSSDTPASIEKVREVQDAIEKVTPYLAEFKKAYLERAERGEFNTLGSSQSMLSRHPTYPVLMRSEAALQQDYLKKLKSKFIETAAKAQFLRFIRNDDGQQWGAEENEQLEAQNQRDKAELRDTKIRLQQSFDRATQLARELEAERPLLVKEAKEANRLAREVNEMRLELMRLGRDKPVEERLTIPAAEEILDNQIVQLQELDTELHSLQESAASHKADAKKVEKEIEALRPAVVQAKAQLQADAAAARAEGREEAEAMSRMCDWYTSAEEMYKDLFGLEAIDTPSENELRLQYSKPVPYTVSLVFNPTTKQLADAKARIPLLGLPGVDISEAIDLAVDANDGRQLLAYARMKATMVANGRV